MVVNKELLIKELQLELARRDFFEFCKLTMPKFYKDDRLYLKELCNEMQSFYESKEDDVLVINVPPRHRQVINRDKIRTMGIRQEYKREDNDYKLQ